MPRWCRPGWKARGYVLACVTRASGDVRLDARWFAEYSLCLIGLYRCRVSRLIRGQPSYLRNFRLRIAVFDATTSITGRLAELMFRAVSLVSGLLALGGSLPAQVEPHAGQWKTWVIASVRYSPAPIRAHRGEQRCERGYRVFVTIWPVAANYLK
jgi:hypothetical protein